MMKLKHSNQTNTVLILINTLIGVALWMLIAAVMSWLTLSERLRESSAIVIAPVTHGIITYITAVISLLGRRGGELICPLIAPVGYLIVQFIVALLFWETNYNDVIRWGLAGVCGIALSIITYKLRSNTGRSKLVRRYSR